MASMGSSWRGRAAILALVAGAVWAASVVAEGPPGNGYGWESVAISAGIVAGAFGLMAYFVHAGTAGRALAAATLAILLAALSIASLIGNWAYQPAGPGRSPRSPLCLRLPPAVSSSPSRFPRCGTHVQHARTPCPEPAR